MPRPQLNFTTDLDRVVALNSQVGLLSQKLTAIERTSSAIFRNDPFANMAVTAGRASGATAAVLKNLQGIHEKLLAINNTNGVLGFSQRTLTPSMTGAVGVSGGSGGMMQFQAATSFIPKAPFKPDTGMLLQPDKFIDPRYGFADLPQRDRTEARETARQLLLVGKRIGTYRIGGMGATDLQRSLSEISRGEGLVNQYYPEGTIRDIGIADIEQKKARAYQAYLQTKAASDAAARRQAREGWNQRNVLIRGYVGSMKGGSLSDADDAALQNLMNLQRDALMNNTMGFSKWRMKAASGTYQGFKTSIGTAPDALLDRVMSASYGFEKQFDGAFSKAADRSYRVARYANAFESQLDSGIQRGLRFNTVGQINVLRNQVDDLFATRGGSRFTEAEQSYAKTLRADLLDKRNELAMRRDGNNLTGTGYDTNSIRGVIKGLDSEINKLDRALRASNSSADALTGSFMRLAGAIVGIQSLRDIFMNATHQAIQFDRTLAQIQARTSRMTDPSLRKGFTESVTSATLADALRTGMPIQQIAQVQETVHLAANGTFQQKAALGSTINNLALTTDTPASEYMGILAPMSKAGFNAVDMRDFLERSSLFQARYGVDKSRMNAFFTSFTSGINALGPLGDLDTIEAAARQEAAGARDMVLGSKLNRIQTSFMSAKTRTRLMEILGRGGQRDSVGEFGIDQILNSGSAVLSMDMISKAYRHGDLSQKELLGVAQTMDQWSGNQTYAMLTKGLDAYRGEIRADRAAVSIGAGSSDRAATLATSSIGGTMDRMTNAITALTVQGITPLGSALKMLMGVVTAVSTGLSKLPYVTETVVSALGALAVGIATQKGFDLASQWVKSARETGSSVFGAIGKAGLIGSAIATVGVVGGLVYDNMNKKSLQANEDSMRSAAAALPGQLRAENAATDALKLLDQIQQAEAKRLDTTGMRHDLEVQIADALKGQKGAEETLLELKRAQTSEMRDQLAIKKLLEISGEARGKRASALAVGSFAQRVISNDEKGSIWNDEKRMETFFTGESASSIEGVYQGVMDLYPAETKKKLSSLLESHKGNKAFALYEFFANKTAFGSSNANVKPLEDYGVTVAYGGFWRGATGEQMNQQQLRIDNELKALPVSGVLERIYTQQALAGKDKTKKTAFATNADFMDLVTLGGDAFGSSALSSTTLTGFLSALNTDTKKVLKAKATTNMDQYAALALKQIQTNPALQKWASEQNNGRNVDADTARKWLLEGANKPVFRGQMPAALQKLSDRAGVLQVMMGLDTDGRAATPERGRAGGGGGGVNFLSIMEKYFSAAERAAGQGDYTGLNTTSSMVADLIAAELPKDAKDRSVRGLIGHLATRSKDTFKLAYDQQMEELDKNKMGLKPHEIARQRTLAREKYDEALLNIEGYELKFNQYASPQGRRKLSRKLVDEALKQNEDEITYTALGEAYQGLDMSTASDIEITNTKLSAQGRILVGKRKDLADQRKRALRGEFADPQAALAHISRLDSEFSRDETGVRRTLARNITAMYGQGWDLEAASMKAWGTTAEMFGSEETKRRVQMQSVTGEMEALMRRQEKMAELGNASAAERLEIESKIKALDIERLKLTEEMAQALKLKQVGDDMTRQTVATLFTGDPTTRNKSLADMWTKLPMQGVSDSITKNLIGLDANNPVGAIARFMFDPGGEMTYKENISRLNDSIMLLIQSNENLAAAYIGSAQKAQAAYTSTPAFNGTPSPIPTATSTTSIEGPSPTTPTATSPASYGLPRILPDGSMSSPGMDLVFGTEVAGATVALTQSGPGASPAQQQAEARQQRVAAAVSNSVNSGAMNTRGGMMNLVGGAMGAATGANFWKAGGKGVRVVNAEQTVKGPYGNVTVMGKKTEMTGMGWGVAGAQMAMAGYSGYMQGKATGSQAAANYGAAGGVLGAAGSAFIAVAATNPVGWVLLAAAAIAQIMAGTEAAAKAAEDKTKAYKKQEADFMRQIAVNEEQRKQLGLAADRVLSERADVGNAFTGVAASAFLSGRFASNAMQVNVQNLTVQANNPQELSAALAGTFTQQVGRGLS